jgi:hypothetical protein
MDKEDLEYMLKFIDAMAQRGAIRGDEMASVASLRARVVMAISDEQGSGTDTE